MVRLIRLAGSVVAVAGPRHYYLLPEYAVLPGDDRRRRLVVLMCVCWHRASAAPHSALPTDQEVEACARYVLAKLEEPPAAD